MSIRAHVSPQAQTVPTDAYIQRMPTRMSPLEASRISKNAAVAPTRRTGAQCPCETPQPHSETAAPHQGQPRARERFQMLGSKTVLGLVVGSQTPVGALSSAGIKRADPCRRFRHLYRIGGERHAPPHSGDG
jgi:hypothetical protein